jgi:2-polyprenyl-6-methoxyphenol hydroxylase-like FAD-dependent oxidoreductase
VVAETKQWHGAYVVGADGHGSIVRRSARIAFPEISDARYYAVFEFESDFDAQHEARIVLSDTTADVLWPLPGGRCRWSFELPEHMEPADEQFRGFMAVTGADLPAEREKDRSLRPRPPASPLLTEEHLRELMAERAPWFQASIGPLSWRTVVRFERRMADAYGSGRMWLAGDSAHLAAPLAVQSMNVGLAEAADLAATLGRVIQGRAEESELCGYGEKWTAVWRQLHGLERPLHASAAASPWIRAHAQRLIECLPAYGEGLAPIAAQLGLDA